MKNTLHLIHHHAKRLHRHIKKHHKKYLFGIFGGFAVAKLFLLVAGLGVVQYSVTSTFAQLADGCELTGQYYTGEYQTGCIDVPEALTGGYLTGCETIAGYWTGGTLNESGELVDQTRVEESQVGCVLTGQEIIPGYTTGCYLTGGYRTGGTVICDEEIGTGNQETGDIQTGNIITGGSGICESGDIVWSAPISGSITRDIFSIGWSYSGTDCLTGLSLQLWDHNGQRINVSNLVSGTTGYSFDSKSLYSFQNSGFYHVIGTGDSGQQIYLYTGTYSGNYSRLFSGYKLRLLTQGLTSIYETPLFTIDNQAPTLTGVSLLANGLTTGYVSTGGVVTLTFIASEELTGLQVALGSGKIATSSTVSGLQYSYIRNLNSGYVEGVLATNISFVDRAGNTGAVLYTGLLTFDKTRPTVGGFVFTGNTSGLYLNFSSSEPVRYTATYRTTGSGFLSGLSTEYLTAQQLSFSGIVRSQVYTFSLDVFDRAGNSRSITGDFVYTNLGTIIQHTHIIPVTDENLGSTLAVVLKAEVEKFNTCKDALTYTPVELEVRGNTFTLQMPIFKKSQVKTLVNAFTLFVLNKIKNNYEMTTDNIAEITKKFDSFLIVLKLLRDDDNTCKQNLSNYHISQFKNALEEYNLEL